MIQGGLIEQLEFPSTMDSLSKIEGLIEGFCEQCKVSDDYYGNILIALTEGVNNAITHGNQLDPNKKVNLNMETTSEVVEFTIKDEGLGFDFNSVPDPTLPQNLEKLRGRGVFLMRNLADEVSFEDNGTIVKLKFTVVKG
jgi:serine/threonine-protein kinase RsbW